MKRPRAERMKILVLDVGGSHVKCIASGRKRVVKFKSGPKMTPKRMVAKVRKITRKWRFAAVSIGYPGVVRRERIAREPHNLAHGWVGFDFQGAFGCPVRMINDAAMQALGAYQGGKMLFLGLGTGLGSTLFVEGEIAALELGHLPCAKARTYEDDVGDAGRKRLGGKAWRRKVMQMVEAFRKALLPDYIVLGGGNVRRLKRLPPRTRRGRNADAIRGGYRLWERRDDA
jgi:polyphosphate glucokinase